MYWNVKSASVQLTGARILDIIKRGWGNFVWHVSIFSGKMQTAVCNKCKHVFLTVSFLPWFIRHLFLIANALKNVWHFLTLPVICRNKNRKLWKKSTLPTISYFDLRWILMASWGRRPRFYESALKSASMMSGAKGFIQTMQHLEKFVNCKYWRTKK